MIWMELVLLFVCCEQSIIYLLFWSHVFAWSPMKYMPFSGVNSSTTMIFSLVVWFSFISRTPTQRSTSAAAAATTSSPHLAPLRSAPARSFGRRCTNCRRHHHLVTSVGTTALVTKSPPRSPTHLPPPPPPPRGHQPMHQPPPPKRNRN